MACAAFTPASTTRRIIGDTRTVASGSPFRRVSSLPASKRENCWCHSSRRRRADATAARASAARASATITVQCEPKQANVSRCSVGTRDRRAHDWLVVTLLTVPPLELSFELELDPDPEEPESDVVEEEPLVCELVADVVAVPDPELDVTVAAEEWLASAGSWPDMSTIVISSQAATNSATDPLTIRRRIVRARATRCWRMAAPRARAASALVSLMVRYLVVGRQGAVKRGGSFVPAHLSRV